MFHNPIFLKDVYLILLISYPTIYFILALVLGRKKLFIEREVNEKQLGEINRLENHSLMFLGFVLTSIVFITGFYRNDLTLAFQNVQYFLISFALLFLAYFLLSDTTRLFFTLTASVLYNTSLLFIIHGFLVFFNYEIITIMIFILAVIILFIHMYWRFEFWMNLIKGGKTNVRRQKKSS